MSVESKINSLITAANTKTGKTDADLTSAMQSLVDGYGGGETVYMASSGSFAMYKKRMDFPYNGTPNLENCSELEEIHAPVFAGRMSNFLRNCAKLKIVDIPGVTALAAYIFSGCSQLETLNFPNMSNDQYAWRDSATFRGCTSLKNVQFGSIGHSAYPTGESTRSPFAMCKQADLTITIYVPDDAELPIANQPWGATNATIVYRSVTTGEVIEG